MIKKNKRYIKYIIVSMTITSISFAFLQNIDFVINNRIIVIVPLIIIPRIKGEENDKQTMLVIIISYIYILMFGLSIFQQIALIMYLVSIYYYFQNYEKTNVFLTNLSNILAISSLFMIIYILGSQISNGFNLEFRIVTIYSFFLSVLINSIFIMLGNYLIKK